MPVSYFKDKFRGNGFYSNDIKCLKGEDFGLHWVFVPHTRDQAGFPRQPGRGGRWPEPGLGRLGVSPAPPRPAAN